jgi:hypothetical protein
MMTSHGNADLPFGGSDDANREIGVPGAKASAIKIINS